LPAGEPGDGGLVILILRRRDSAVSKDDACTVLPAIRSIVRRRAAFDCAVR
jgi:hypothetical protein